jgi:type VI secretion system protein ImpH
MARFFVGPELDFDVQPLPKPEEVPPCQLLPGERDGFHLGWNIWLQTRPLDRPVDDAVFVLKNI